jgi:hypothetical protein
MIRGLVSQIDPKKELKFWTTLIIVLLKEQSMVYIHRTRKIAPTVSIIHKEIKDSINISKSKLTLTLIDLNQTFAFARGYFWGIRPIIRKPHIICAVILVNPCFIQVQDIIPCFHKRFDLSQIITPIIDNRHLVVQNSSIIEGLIDGCDLVFLAKSKDGDYHQEMNSFVFLEWFENQLMPALKNPRLVFFYKYIQDQ